MLAAMFLDSDVVGSRLPNVYEIHISYKHPVKMTGSLPCFASQDYCWISALKDYSNIKFKPANDLP
jgi:hypothetical protein